jgi:hypothetical protein
LALERKGYIIRTNEPRGIRLVMTMKNLSLLNIWSVYLFWLCECWYTFGFCRRGKSGILKVDKDIIGKVKETSFGYCKRRFYE